MPPSRQAAKTRSSTRNRGPSGFSVSTAVGEFLHSKAAEGLSPRTLHNYDRYLRTWVEWAGDPPIDSVTTNSIRSYLAWLLFPPDENIQRQPATLEGAGGRRAPSRPWRQGSQGTRPGPRLRCLKRTGGSLYTNGIVTSLLYTPGLAGSNPATAGSCSHRALKVHCRGCWTEPDIEETSRVQMGLAPSVSVR